LKRKRRNKNQQKNHLVAIKKKNKLRFQRNALTHKNNEYAKKWRIISKKNFCYMNICEL
jgi:hypothetical protein